MSTLLLRLVLLFAGATLAGAAAAQHAAFTFESVRSLDEMTAYIRDRFPLGSERLGLREKFVGEGQATLIKNPNEADVEKYIYDINLCSLYVWRWNISADFDTDGKLRQAYLNGNPVFADGTPKRSVSKVAEAGKNASLYRARRARPEAVKGESTLVYFLFDRDSDLKTTHDQVLVGAGPSRLDPINFGKMVGYADVDPWRSIFDDDAAERIVNHAGDCTAAHKAALDGVQKAGLPAR